ncbi:MAG: hypothetical protein KDA81_20145, partial [Planctomycetaceae bacterium]|nr:hypothetical protein [Planctomycetaceae bacterium]
MRHPDQLRVRNAFFVRWLATVFSGVICLLNAAGCATTPYTFGASNRYIESPQLAEITGPQFERGNPNVVLDSVGWVIGIPSKILLLDHRVDNHRVDRATEAEVAAYLEQNQLRTVKVRVNQYHPGDDWKRLVANKSVGAGWRYTLGALSVVGETLLPGR